MANDPLSTEARIYLRHAHATVRQHTLDYLGTDWPSFEKQADAIMVRDIAPKKHKAAMEKLFHPLTQRKHEFGFTRIHPSGTSRFECSQVYLASGWHPFDHAREHGLLTHYRRYHTGRTRCTMAGAELCFVNDHTIGRVQERSDLSINELLARLVLLGGIIINVGPEHMGGGLSIPITGDLLLVGTLRAKDYTNRYGTTKAIPFLDIRTALPAEWASPAQLRQAEVVAIAINAALEEEDCDDLIAAIPLVPARQDYITRSIRERVSESC